MQCAALRWRVFLAPDRIPAGRIIGIYYIATFLNWLLPFQGGEVAKCLILRRTDGIVVSRSLATVAMDKTMDLLPAVVILSVVPLAQLQVGGGLWVFLAFRSSSSVSAGWSSRSQASSVNARSLRCRRSCARSSPGDSPTGWSRSSSGSSTRSSTWCGSLASSSPPLATRRSPSPSTRFFRYLAFRAIGTTLGLPIVLYGVHLLQPGVHLPYAARAPRQQRAHRLADLLGHLRRRPIGGRGDVRLLPPVHRILMTSLPGQHEGHGPAPARIFRLPDPEMEAST